MMKMMQLHYAKMLAGIVDDGATITEIVNDTGLHRHTVAEYMTALHKERVIHIVGWERFPTNNMWTPVYKLGRRYDTRKPKPLTHYERQQRHRDKIKAMLLHRTFNEALREAA